MSNAIQANIMSLFTEEKNALNEVYNIACSQEISLNQMIGMSNKISNKEILPEYLPPRPGDVGHSKADISKANELLGYVPDVLFEEGLHFV